MSILSVVIPSYNSENYLSNCIESLLKSGDGIEILIVNDGSLDSTGEIADSYAKKHPNKIKVIHQENAGHGGAINAGLKHAAGRYFKVVDSDDWVNPEALKKVVKKLNRFIADNIKVDLVLANFVYDKTGSSNKKVMNYRGIIPQDMIITWNDVGKFKTSKYILMHSVIFSMDILKKSGLRLPRHTFYVDNLFVYIPLQYVEKMYYIDECVYHYFIGRDEQSVNEKNMIKRIDQQLLVNKTMIESVDLCTIQPISKREYMIHYLNVVTTVSSVLLIKKGTAESICKNKDLWNSIRMADSKLYSKMRKSILGRVIHLPGYFGRKVTLYVYKRAQKAVGFN